MNKFAILLSLILLFPLNIRQAPGISSVKTNYQQGLVGSYEAQTCLEKTLHTEAIGEPLEGIIAVLHVIQNRINHRNYPSTLCKVVLQPKQFSWFNRLNTIHNNQIPLESIKTPFKGSLTLKEQVVQGISHQAAVEHKKASEIARSVLGRKLNPELQKVLDSKDVLFYHSASVQPIWSKKMQKVAKVGNHIFYKMLDNRRNTH